VARRLCRLDKAIARIVSSKRTPFGGPRLTLCLDRDVPRMHRRAALLGPPSGPPRISARLRIARPRARRVVKPSSFSQAVAVSRCRSRPASRSFGARQRLPPPPYPARRQDRLYPRPLTTSASPPRRSNSGSTPLCVTAPRAAVRLRVAEWTLPPPRIGYAARRAWTIRPSPRSRWLVECVGTPPGAPMS